MKYFSMFSGIGTGEKGIEQAFSYHQQQPPDSRATDGKRRGERDTDERGVRVHATDESALCDGNRTGEKGIEQVCIGFSEIDKYAKAIYRYHYPGHKNYGDATRIVPDELPDFDFLIGGFPCQAFSIAGKRKGFDDTRGTLFFEIARILRGKQPPHFLLENVKGLLSHNDGNTFATIISALDEIGYDLEWTLCNSKHFGVPQNRERVFIVGHLRGVCGRKVLPIGEGNEETNEPTSGYKVEGDAPHLVGAEHRANCIDTNYWKGPDNHRQRSHLVQPVLTPDRPEKRQNGRRFKDNGEEMFTLTAQDQHGVMTGELKQVGNVDTLGHNSIWGRVYDSDGISATLNSEGGGMGAKTGLYLQNARIRRLTPTECERLQGLPDGWTRLGRFGDEIREISDTQRYKGLGNAFTVNVIEWLMTQLIVGGCVE